MDEAISALDIEFSDKQREKLSNMLRHARKLQNSKAGYGKQRKESFGSSEGTRIFEATESLL